MSAATGGGEGAAPPQGGKSRRVDTGLRVVSVTHICSVSGICTRAGPRPRPGHLWASPWQQHSAVPPAPHLGLVFRDQEIRRHQCRSMFPRRVHAGASEAPQEAVGMDTSAAGCVQTGPGPSRLVSRWSCSSGPQRGSPPLTQLSRHDPDTSGATAPGPCLPLRGSFSWETQADTFQNCVGGCLFPQSLSLAFTSTRF